MFDPNDGSCMADALSCIMGRPSTDDDVILLSARLGDGAPVPLRWDDGSRRSVGLLLVPASMVGTQEIFFEAVDAAKNRGFARARVEVLP